jgi:hypothetical protein
MTLESTENAPNLERLTPPGTLGDAVNAKKRRTEGLIGKPPARLGGKVERKLRADNPSPAMRVQIKSLWKIFVHRRRRKSVAHKIESLFRKVL